LLQVCRIVVQTMIATEPALSSATRAAGGPNLLRSCFEVFGFDVLLDTQLRAWLLEVNTCPALNADSPLDMEVKTNMVGEVVEMLKRRDAAVEGVRNCISHPALSTCWRGYWCQYMAAQERFQCQCLASVSSACSPMVSLLT
jgi:hypothetical protein